MEIRDRIKCLKRVRASELRKNPRNWRRHPATQRAALAGLLKEIGYADALLARETRGGRLELIDGHLRADVTPDAKVPVLVLDLNQQEADVLLATLDPLAALAETDEASLAALLRDVRTDDAGLADFVSGLAATCQPAVDEFLDADGALDAIPAPPAAPITRAGDLWRLGPHRLLCGDSARAADVDRLVAGEPIHLVHMDPPYNVKVEPRSNNAIAAAHAAKRVTHHQALDAARRPSTRKATTAALRPKDRPLANDFVSPAEFDRLLAAWFGSAARVLSPGRAFYVWGGYANLANYPAALKAAGMFFAQTVIWIKEHPVLTRKDFMGDHEWCFYGWRETADKRTKPALVAADFPRDHRFALYGWREGAAHQFFGPQNVSDVWRVKKLHPDKMVHLTEKPVELPLRAVSYSSRPGEHVLDLFGGGGGTLVACEKLGRRARLMEIDPLYCDVIVERWRQLTGDQPQRERG